MKLRKISDTELELFEGNFIFYTLATILFGIVGIVVTFLPFISPILGDSFLKPGLLFFIPVFIILYFAGKLSITFNKKTSELRYIFRGYIHREDKTYPLTSIAKIVFDKEFISMEDADSYRGRPLYTSRLEIHFFDQSVLPINRSIGRKYRFVHNFLFALLSSRGNEGIGRDVAKFLGVPFEIISSDSTN